MKPDKELMGASTALLVLALLAKEPSYGYEVVKRINAESDGLLEWQEGTVYPILHKLEKEKQVRSQWQEAASGRRRKYYYITAQGRERLADQVEQWNLFHGLVNRVADVPIS